jgi:hypothetical protein
VQTRTRNAITFGAAAVIAAAGLALLARARRPPDLASHAIDAIPSGALLVAAADLAALRASPAGAPFLREGREIPGLGKVRDVCGFEPMDTITEVAVAIPADGDAGEFGLVAAGPLDDEALLACATKVIDARGGRAVTTTLGSFRAVRDASLAAGGGEIAVRRGGPLLLGAGTYLRAMIDTADQRAPTIRSSQAHAFLGRAVGDASVRVTVVLTPELRRTLADELSRVGAPGSPAAAIFAGALGVTLGPRVSLHAVLSCESAAAAQALAAKLSEVRDEKAQDFAVRLVGFGAVLKDLHIVPEGEIVHARVDMPAEQAALLADRLLTLRGIRHPAGAAGAPPLPAPSAAPRTTPPPPDEVIKPDGGPSRAPDGGASSAPRR